MRPGTEPWPGVLAQDPRQAEGELALDEARETDLVVIVETRRLEEALAGVGDQSVARGGDPASGGGAVNAVERGDVVDARPLDEVEAEQRAIARFECGGGVGDRLPDLLAVLGLGVDGVAGDAGGGRLGGLAVGDPPATAAEVEGDPGGGDLDEPGEPATPGVGQDTGLVGATDEQALSQGLCDLVTVVVGKPEAAGDGGDAGEVARLERSDRGGVAGGAGGRDIDLGAVVRGRGTGDGGREVDLGDRDLRPGRTTLEV